MFKTFLIGVTAMAVMLFIFSPEALVIPKFAKWVWPAIVVLVIVGMIADKSWRKP